jgi:hypothetical protein
MIFIEYERRKYNMLLKLRKFHRSQKKKLKKSLATGSFEKKRIKDGMDKENNLIIKYNKCVKDMRKLDYFEMLIS